MSVHRDFVSCIEAIAPLLTDEQKQLVLACAAAQLEDASPRIEAIRRRHLFERQWEESQLSGPELARRQREPA